MDRKEFPQTVLCMSHLSLYVTFTLRGALVLTALAIGAASAIVFSCFGAAYGTAKASGGIVSTGIMRPEGIFRLILPVIMAGVIGIYGLVVSVLISNKINQYMALSDAFKHLAAGLSVGLSGLVAGFSIGVVGDVGSRALAQQPRLFTGTMLILVFAEVLGLYGLIIGLIFSSSENVKC